MLGIEVTWLYGMEYRPLLPMNSMEEMFYWYVTISSTVNTIKYSSKHKFTLQYIDSILANSW